MSLFRAVPFALCLASPAMAQGTFTWFYDAEFPIFLSDARLNLIATDQGNVDAAAPGALPGGIIWAQCLSEFDAGEAAIRFESFAGAAQSGDTVSLTLTGDDGASVTVPAQIENRGNDPVGGPTILVTVDGPEMAILANSDRVTYGVEGVAVSFLEHDLSTNRAYVQAFIDDCLGVAAGGELQRAGSGPETVAGPLTPELGPDISGHVWTRFTQVDEFDPLNTMVSMSYAVPESDDVVIAGQCIVDADASSVLLQVTADVAGMQNGDPVDLRVQIPDGRSAILQGNVIGVGAEFGIAGIEYVTNVSDPAWLVIAGDTTVRFDRPDTGIGLTITGNGPNTIGPFLADCAEATQLDPENGGRPGAPIDPQPGFLACDNFGRVASRDTGVAQVVNFINSSDGYRFLSWIDPTGAVVDVTSFDPGQAAAYTTDPGHVWMATDGIGNCMEMMQVPAGVSDYRITVISQ